jgi:hypothetical protein
MVASQNGFSLEKYLCLQLQAFRLLGLESRALMAKTLKNQSPITKGLYDALWKHWYADGGAAGRYLLRVSENLDLVSGSTLGDALRDWIRDEMPSPGYLWPASLPALPDAQAVALNKFHPKENDFEITWLTPFGPEKAEREGRLPVRDMGDKLPGGFFWDGHPLKKEIWAQRDGIVVAPPGSGRTTLLWMARHEYRFAGRHPALSLYIALQSLPTEETLFQKCRRVFFETVISTLSEDPFWLLDTQTQYRSEIIGFLLFEAGGHEPLARHIIFQGLSSGRFSSLSEDQQRAMRARERADQDLLIELCYQHTIQEIEGWQDLQALITMTRLPMARARGCTPQNFPTFFWFDVQTADPDQEQIFIQRLHRNEVLHRLGNIKVFLPVPLPDRTVPRLEWSESLLQSLLEYRWKRADLTRSDWRKLIEALEISDPVAHLIAKAKGSPQHLIRAGNQMLQRWGNYLSSERATEGEIG